MAAIITKYSTGRQARMIQDAFASRSLSGVGLGTPCWENLIQTGAGIAQARFSTPPGTVIQETPDGRLILVKRERREAARKGVEGTTEALGGMADAFGAGSQTQPDAQQHPDNPPEEPTNEEEARRSHPSYRSGCDRHVRANPVLWRTARIRRHQLRQRYQAPSGDDLAVRAARPNLRAAHP